MTLQGLILLLKRRVVSIIFALKKQLESSALNESWYKLSSTAFNDCSSYLKKNFWSNEAQNVL